MGIQISNMFHTSPLINRYNQEQWQCREQLRHCMVLYNKKLDISSDCYQLPCEYLQENLKIYQDRRPGTPENRDIVWIYHVVLQQNDFLCNKENFIKVFTQHIPLKLSNIDYLQESQALGVLKSALQGYHYLSQQYQCPQPNQNCIGFNQTGKVKVWMNQNFSVNASRILEQKECQGSQIQTQNEQQRNRYFVKLLSDSVFKYSKNINPFLVEYFEANKPNYQQGIRILEDYAQKTRVRIASVIRLSHFKGGKFDKKVREYNQNHQEQNVLSKISNTKFDSNMNNQRNPSNNVQNVHLKRLNSVGSLLKVNINYQRVPQYYPSQANQNLNIQRHIDRKAMKHAYQHIQHNKKRQQNRQLQRVYSNHNTFHYQCNQQQLARRNSFVYGIKRHSDNRLYENREHLMHRNTVGVLNQQVFNSTLIQHLQSPVKGGKQQNTEREADQYKSKRENNRIKLKNEIQKQYPLVGQQIDYTLRKQFINKQSVKQIINPADRIDCYSSDQAIEQYIRRKFKLVFQQEKQNKNTNQVQINEKIKLRQFQYIRDTDRGDSQLGRHNLMTFMPRDKQNQFLEVSQLDQKIQTKYKQKSKNQQKDGAGAILSAQDIQNRLIQYIQNQIHEIEAYQEQTNNKFCFPSKRLSDQKQIFDKNYSKIAQSIDQKYEKYIKKKQSIRNIDNQLNEDQFKKHHDRKVSRLERQSSQKQNQIQRFYSSKDPKRIIKYQQKNRL